jgi:nucleotide-binding universal stress UspA family protein
VKAEPVRILVPLERGESAREPARLLGGLFAPKTVRVRALNVGSVAVPLLYLPPGLEPFESLRRKHLDWEQKTRSAMERQVAPLEDAGFAVEVEVAAGSALSEVLKLTELWRADLVVARPRRKRVRSAGMGSVAAGLMQAASAPVLFYRSVSSGYRVRRVLVPVDFSPFSRKAVGWGLLLASLARAGVRLLHVLPETSARWAQRLRRMALDMVREERQRAETQVRRFGSRSIPIEGIVMQRKDAGRGILEAQKDCIDLVVVGASGKTGVASVLGSVTRRVVRDCPCPVLVVPTASRADPLKVWRNSAR